jgi:hypothetical protein
MAGRLRALAIPAGLPALLVLAAACAHTRTAVAPAPEDPDPASPVATPATLAPPPPPPGEAAPIAARPITTSAHPRTYPFPVATLPGFEMLPDGGSRVFVEITRKVDVEERRSARVLTYVLKGAHVVYRNNENALVTVHFNTPVTKARLLPSGRDLLFSVDLRADSPATWKMVTDSDGSATLQVDFPKGSFLPAGDVDMPAEHPMAGGVPPGHPPPVNPSNPPPAPARWSRGGGGGGRSGVGGGGHVGITVTGSPAGPAAGPPGN